ncbi:MAG: type III pantothenate kinase [Candidatus Omnitrophica bacterium]|nr:type III pantothenate kinase [Candidatus Omnitrophota bacterium]
MSRNTLFCLDIGNTSLSYGLYRKGRFVLIGRESSDRFPHFRRKLIGIINKNPISYILVTSVVPEITLKLSKLAGKLPRKTHCLIVGKSISIPIRHKYRKGSQLGWDRLVNAWGAQRIYGAPVLILDYGTALTCDLVSKAGVFEGGLIIPGPEVAFKALSRQARLLPSLKFPSKAKEFIGRNTVSGMRSGILQAYGAMTDGLVQRFRQRFGRRLRAVATGGYAKVLSAYSREIDVLDPLLTLKGLVEVFKASKFSKIPS